MFDVKYDETTRIVHVKLTGLWNVGTMVLFAAKMMTTLTAIRLRHSNFKMLTDLSEFPVQTKLVAEAGAKMMQGELIRPTRDAFVVSAMLMKAQTERIVTSERTRVFLNRPEALAWLMSDEE